MVVLGGSSLVPVGFDWFWLSLLGSGRFLLVLVGCGRSCSVMVDPGWFCSYLVGPGWFWLVLVGPGSSWLVLFICVTFLLRVCIYLPPVAMLEYCALNSLTVSQCLI